VEGCDFDLCQMCVGMTALKEEEICYPSGKVQPRAPPFIIGEDRQKIMKECELLKMFLETRIDPQGRADILDDLRSKMKDLKGGDSQIKNQTGWRKFWGKFLPDKWYFSWELCKLGRTLGQKDLAIQKMTYGLELARFILDEL